MRVSLGFRSGPGEERSMRLHNMIAAAVFVVVAGTLAFFGLRFFRSDTFHWKEDASPFKETDIQLPTPVPNLSSSSLSPNGAQLATLNVAEEFDAGGGASYRSQLVIRSLQSSQVVATL